MKNLLTCILLFTFLASSLHATAEETPSTQPPQLILDAMDSLTDMGIKMDQENSYWKAEDGVGTFIVFMESMGGIGLTITTQGSNDDLFIRSITFHGIIYDFQKKIDAYAIKKGITATKAQEQFGEHMSDMTPIVREYAQVEILIPCEAPDKLQKLGLNYQIKKDIPLLMSPTNGKELRNILLFLTDISVNINAWGNFFFTNKK